MFLIFIFADLVYISLVVLLLGVPICGLGKQALSALRLLPLQSLSQELSEKLDR